MSKISLMIIRFLNCLVKEPLILKELDLVKRSIELYQTWEYEEIRRIFSDFGGYWDLKGKTMLDVGCGLGGKLLFYDESGAADVVGIDIRLQSVNSAMQLHMKRAHNVIKVLNSDSAYMPFPSNYFDVIISINVLEHVDNIRATMLECKRVLRPDGIIFLHFPPFYSPWGAHLEGWINFPWPHVLFRDSQLLEAAQWFEDKKKNNKEYIFSANVDWLKHSQLPELNRTTIDQFEKLLRDVELKILHTDLLPFGRHYLQKFGLIGKIIFRLLKILTILPGLREIVTTKMVFIITK